VYVGVRETYDIAKYKEYSEIVDVAQLLYPGVNIFWMKPMISKTQV